MILSGTKIDEEVKKGKIIIEPYNFKDINPNSYNYTLGSYVKVYKNMELDPRKKQEVEVIQIPDDGLIIYFDQGSIAPKEFGTSKFKLSFKKFAPYINPRFYCDATNLKRRMFRR